MLLGLGSNDTLNGGLGNDQWNGGSGQDKFVLNTALNVMTNKDTITGFSPVDDTLVLENAIFTKFGATGTLPAEPLSQGPGRSRWTRMTTSSTTRRRGRSRMMLMGMERERPWSL